MASSANAAALVKVERPAQPSPARSARIFCPVASREPRRV